MRLAGAPISWGVSEAPDWGYELPPDRVLAEMRSLGLSATELGPTGYLGADARSTLDRHGMRLVGGFLPVPMHAATEADLADAHAAIDTLAVAGAEVVVLAARSVDGSYDRKVRLTDAEWPVLLSTLDALRRYAASRGLAATLHPHVGTAIEDRASVLRLLEGSDVPLCLDTGHLLIGGTDPVELLSLAPQRIAHVHLKDVRASVAAAVSAGDSSYLGAIRAGLYAPLGDGDVDIAAILARLTDAGYSGWYVLEQDAALHGPPDPGTGPVDDVRRSLDYLAKVSR
jgi:inosose dehydratase